MTCHRSFGLGRIRWWRSTPLFVHPFVSDRGWFRLSLRVRYHQLWRLLTNYWYELCLSLDAKLNLRLLWTVTSTINTYLEVTLCVNIDLNFFDHNFSDRPTIRNYSIFWLLISPKNWPKILEWLKLEGMPLRSLEFLNRPLGISWILIALHWDAFRIRWNFTEYRFGENLLKKLQIFAR